MKLDACNLLYLCLLGHLIADFTLQGCLAKMKQKMWWDESVANWNRWNGKKLSPQKYRLEHVTGLICHGMYWSLFTFLPLMLNGVNSKYLLIAVIVNAFIHAFIDHLKANLFKINLCKDQLLHFMQIVITIKLFIDLT